MVDEADAGSSDAEPLADTASAETDTGPDTSLAPDADASVDSDIDAPVDADIDAPVDTDIDAPVDADIDAPVPDSAADSDAAIPPDAWVTWTYGDAAAVSPPFVASTAPCGPMGGTDPSVVVDSLFSNAIEVVGRRANRALVAGGGAWALFDVDTGAKTASGTTETWMKFAHGGATFAVQQTSGIELRDATSGALRATIAAAPPFGFATDGSYVFTIEASRVRFWSSTTGALIATRPGSFSTTDYQVHAGPTEFRIARSGLYDRIDPKTGAILDSLSYAGVAAWFSGDGSTLAAGSSLLSATTLAVVASPVPYPAAAYGTMLVTSSGVIDYVTKATLLTWPAMSGQFLRDRSLVFITRPGGARWVDLSTSPPTTGDVALEGATYLTSLAVDTDGTWVVGDNSGVAWTGKTTARPLGCGRATAVAAADDGSVAIATTRGVVLGNVGATTSTLSGYIPLASDCLELSRDGKMLAILDTVGDEGGIARVHLYSLTTKTAGLVLERPVGVGATRIRGWSNVSFDQTGARIAISAWGDFESSTRIGTHAVLDAATGALVRRWELTSAPGYSFAAWLSPDGKHLARAIPTGTFTYATLRMADVATGTETALGLDPYGWLGDRVLAYDDSIYAKLVDATGAVVPTGPTSFGYLLSRSPWFETNCRPRARQISSSRIFLGEVYDGYTGAVLTSLGGKNATTSTKIVHLAPDKVTALSFPP